jgi:hypothetical protein
MTLHPPARAPRVEDKTAAVLRHFVPAHYPSASGETIAGHMMILPAFGIPTRALAEDHRPKPTRRGWRAAWVEAEGAAGATIEFRRTRGRRPMLSSCSFGTKAAELARAIARAGDEVSGEETLFRIALIVLPAVQMEALWLRPLGRKSRERLIGLTDAIDDAAFLAEASRRARVMLEAQGKGLRTAGSRG